MSATNWVTTEDEYGIYKERINEFGILEKLIEYKQKWHDENPPIEPVPQPPTLEEQLAERDKQILELTVRQSVTDRVVADNGLMQQEILELLIDMGV